MPEPRMPRREHRTMDREAQHAAGAHVRHREGMGAAPGARPGSGSRPGAGPAAGTRANVSAGTRRRGIPATPPRTVSAYEARDVRRYQQMRRERSGFDGDSGNGGDRQRGRGRARRIVPVAIIGVLAALIVAVLGFTFSVSGRMNEGITPEIRSALTPAVPGQPFYMLLVGTDKSAEREATGATGGTYRTDSIMLARIDPIGAKVTLVSIQRDTLVDLGEYGQQKINAAYTFGGGPLLVKTVADLAGVNISHYAEIDFDSFTSVVDAIGGITVNVPIDLDDDLANLHIKAGTQEIDGATALALCRARHAYDKYGAGDYFRTANQRMVLGAILKKSLSGNPASLFSTIGSVSKSVTTDLSGFDILFLGVRFLGFDMSKNLMTGLEPTTSKYVNGGWYELLDTTAWQAMMDRVNRGLSPYADASQDPTNGLAGITN